MAEHQLPKLNTGVRFPSPAPKTASIKGYLPFLYFFAFYSSLALLSSLNLSSLAEEGEPRQGKPEGFCLPCKGRWASSRQAGGILRSYMEFK